jgi:DNA polymerase-4
MYFSVEALETPGLAEDTRAIVISVDPRTYPRGVVTTANGVARTLGINSGMSTALAARMAAERGVEMVCIPPRHALYGEYSRRLMNILRTETPLLEQRSIDEAALDWSHHGYDPAPVLALRQHVLTEIGLSISLGVAGTPLVAKMASEQAKSHTDHVCIVKPGASAGFLAPLPIRALVGIGPKSEARMRGLGLERIGDIAAQPLHELVQHFGKAYGRYLHQASRGEDAATLVGEHTYKSISAEHTFGQDTSDRAEIWRRLQAQAQDVAGRLKDEQLMASEVAIKVRYGVTWITITRQQRLATPTDDAQVLAAGAAALMRKAWNRRPIRLIGLRAGRLEAPPDGVQLTMPISS